ncbi:MAG: monovalent cation/H(+) antiporter subunit G [Sneathiellaceae bacterium]
MTDPGALLLEILSWFLLAGGGTVCLIGAIGMHRMPDLYTRMHAVSVIDGLGAAMLLVGMALQAGFSLIALKLVVVLALLLFTSPIAAHALARGALHRGVRPKQLTEDRATRTVLARLVDRPPAPHADGLHPEEAPDSSAGEAAIDPAPGRPAR